MTLSNSDLRKAERRMRARLKTQPRAIAAHYDRRVGRIIVALSNGLELGVPVDLAQGLAGAKAADLSRIEISPTGMGLHWPRLDADLYLPALMEGVFGSRRWMAGAMGKVGGRSTSGAKQSAARANGKLGGRPRKLAPA
jgi:hypothetical protein